VEQLFVQYRRRLRRATILGIMNALLSDYDYQVELLAKLDGPGK
jgi:hypothetical protein